MDGNGHGLLSRGGVAVIIGGRPSNFPEELRGDARLMFWDSTNPDTKRRDLPSNTKAVLMTRFVGHPLFERIVKQARSRPDVTVFPGLMGTGDIKRELEKILHAPPPQEKPAPKPLPEPPPPVQAETPTKPSIPHSAKGVVTSFVHEFSVINADTSPMGEAKRLLPIAEEKKIPTTVNSLATLVRKIQREKFPREPGKAVTPPPPELPVVDMKLAEVLRVFDDSVTGFQLVREFIVSTHARSVELENRIQSFVTQLTGAATKT